MFEVLQQAYQHLYGFVFLTPEQINAYIKQYLGFITPDYIGIVVNRENRVVGFGITLPSLSRALQKSRGRLFPFGFIHFLKALKSNEILDLYLIGVHLDYQGQGVAGVLMEKMGRTFVKKGIRLAESNPELELNNRIQAQWKHFEKRQHKRRRCFIKELQS